MLDHQLLKDRVGLVDNLHDAQPTWNRASAIIGLTVAFAVVTSLCVSLRFYARFIVLKLPGWDDYLMVLVMTMGAVGTICVCLSPGLGGMGRHFITMSTEQRRMHFKLFYIADGSFVMTVFLIKLSLLLQYLRVFDSGIQRRLCQWTFAGVLVWGAVTSFMAWFPCFPVAGFWDFEFEGRKCYGYGSPYYKAHYVTFLAHSAVNMFWDLVIFTIPLPLLCRPGTQRRTKLGLASLLVLGLITNIFAALRLAETVRHHAMAYPTFDHSWYAPTLCMLGMLEVNFACMGASIPVFWPMFRDRIGTIFVTREIKVSVADRTSEDLRLHRSESLYSHDESQEDARRLWHERSNGPSRDAHYKDTYVMDQVDPLRQKTTMAVDAVVTTGDSDTSRKVRAQTSLTSI